MALDYIITENGMLTFNYNEISIPEYEEGSFENRLSEFLREHHFPQEDDAEFIAKRAEIAYEIFEFGRRHRMDANSAMELAMHTLMQYLENSLYDILYEILELHFSLLVAPEDRRLIILDMFSKGLFDEYKDNDSYTTDFLDSDEGFSFKIKLIDIIDQYVTSYGIQ